MTSSNSSDTYLSCTVQVTMMNKEKVEENFAQLNPEELDLTMFTITNLTLVTGVK